LVLSRNCFCVFIHRFTICNIDYLYWCSVVLECVCTSFLFNIFFLFGLLNCISYLLVLCLLFHFFLLILVLAFWLVHFILLLNLLLLHLLHLLLLHPLLLVHWVHLLHLRMALHHVWITVSHSWGEFLALSCESTLSLVTNFSDLFFVLNVRGPVTVEGFFL